MDTNLIITKIHAVYDNELSPGKLNYNYHNKRHSDCFVYVKSGSAQYIFDDYSLVTKAGDILFLSKDSRYKMTVYPDYKFIYIDFDFEKSDFPRKCEVFSNLSPETENLAIKLFKIWIKKNPWYFAEILSMLYTIYFQCIKSCEKKYSPSSKIISNALDYIIENYTNPNLTLNTISSHADVSEVHLRRLFQSALNISPLKYITNLKIKKAKEMLENSNYKISEISSICGFSNPYYFSRIFKSQTGMTPTDYKLQFDNI